jgi:hypothetical protein
MDLVAFCVGLFLGGVWFIVVVLPLAYGVPCSMIWALRGWTSSAPIFKYLGTSLLWFFTFGTAIGLGLWVAPGTTDALVLSDASAWGQGIGIVGGIARALVSPSVRNAVRTDLRKEMVRHLTPVGIRALGRGEFPS